MRWGVKLVMKIWRSSCHPIFYELTESQPHDHFYMGNPTDVCILQCSLQCATYWLIVEVYKQVWFCLAGTVSEILCHDSHDFS